MTLLTRAQAAEWPDPPVREALLAGADINDFCDHCIGLGPVGNLTDHSKCNGRSGPEPDSDLCQCRCQMAALHRWDRDESTEWDLSVALAGYP